MNPVDLDISTAPAWPKTPADFISEFPFGITVHFAQEGSHGFPLLTAFAGQFEITIGCQDRTVDRWLRYGLKVARSYGLGETSAGIYAAQVKAIASALGMGIPDSLGEGLIDDDDEEAFGPEDDWDDDDDDEYWDDEGEDDDEDDDEEDDWEEDEEEDEEEFADAE